MTLEGHDCQAWIHWANGSPSMLHRSWSSWRIRSLYTSVFENHVWFWHFAQHQMVRTIAKEYFHLSPELNCTQIYTSQRKWDLKEISRRCHSSSNRNDWLTSGWRKSGCGCCSRQIRSGCCSEEVSRWQWRVPIENKRQHRSRHCSRRERRSNHPLTDIWIVRAFLYVDEGEWKAYRKNQTSEETIPRKSAMRRRIEQHTCTYSSTDE